MRTIYDLKNKAENRLLCYLIRKLKFSAKEAEIILKDFRGKFAEAIVKDPDNYGVDLALVAFNTLGDDTLIKFLKSDLIDICVKNGIPDHEI